jgi:hypothetical protein
MTHRFGLGQAGERERGLAQEAGERSRRDSVGFVEIYAAFSAQAIRLAQFKNQRLFQRQAAISASGLRCQA